MAESRLRNYDEVPEKNYWVFHKDDFISMLLVISFAADSIVYLYAATFCMGKNLVKASIV